MSNILNNVAVAIIFALLLVLVQGYTEDDVEQAIEKCLMANNISQEEYAEVLNTTSAEEDEENVEMKYKCFIHCLAEELDMIDSRGYVDIDFIENNEDLTEANRAAFKECKMENDHLFDMCEYAYKFAMCLKEKFRESDYNNDNE